MKTIITFLFVICILSSFAQNEGEAAPDFTLTQLSGGDFKLSDHLDKVVFIFWLGDNCPLCKAVAPSIKTEIVDIFKSNADFVAIGIDTWDGSTSGVTTFKTQTGLDINYLLKGSGIANNYGTIYDRLSVVDKNGILVHKGATAASGDISKAKDAITAALDVSTSVRKLNENLTVFRNYPNPFSNQTTIQFKVEESSMVSLDVYDISGKKVREITNRQYPSGDHHISFTRGSLEKGLYFLRLKNDSFISVQKMIVQ